MGKNVFQKRRAGKKRTGNQKMEKRKMGLDPGPDLIFLLDNPLWVHLGTYDVFDS